MLPVPPPSPTRQSWLLLQLHVCSIRESHRQGCGPERLKQLEKKLDFGVSDGGGAFLCVPCGIKHLLLFVFNLFALFACGDLSHVQQMFKKKKKLKLKLLNLRGERAALGRNRTRWTLAPSMKSSSNQSPSWDCCLVFACISSPASQK